MLSLLLASSVGFWLFTTPGETPLAVHALFLILIIVFLIGMLHGIRSHISRWIEEQSHDESHVARERGSADSERRIHREGSPTHADKTYSDITHSRE